MCQSFFVCCDKGRRKEKEKEKEREKRWVGVLLCREKQWGISWCSISLGGFEKGVNLRGLFFFVFLFVCLFVCLLFVVDVCFLNVIACCC